MLFRSLPRPYKATMEKKSTRLHLYLRRSSISLRTRSLNKSDRPNPGSSTAKISSRPAGVNLNLPYINSFSPTSIDKVTMESQRSRSQSALYNFLLPHVYRQSYDGVSSDYCCGFPTKREAPMEGYISCLDNQFRHESVPTKVACNVQGRA